MHSSRMRTGRSLTVCCSLLPGGVGGVSAPGGFSLPGGGGDCLSAPRGGSSLLRGGLPARGVLPARRPPP